MQSMLSFMNGTMPGMQSTNNKMVPTYLDLKMVALQNSNIPGSVMRGQFCSILFYDKSYFLSKCSIFNARY